MREPAHLLGMYHILARKGHQVEISSQPLRHKLSRLVQRFHPHFVGFTAYREHVSWLDYVPEEQTVYDSLQEYASLIKAMQEEGIKIGIGGRGATLNPDHFVRTYHPDFLVKGLGESPMLALAEAGFNPHILEKDYRGNIDETAVLEAPGGEKWIEVSYERPYSLFYYRNRALVTVQIGCFGRCIFCAEDHRISYRSLEYTIDELRHVLDIGARSVTLGGANFTASPVMAAQIIEAIVRSGISREARLSIGTREDSLYESFTRFPRIWEEFLDKYRMDFAIGIESFIPEKTVALGKYNDLDKARGASRRLEEIIRFIQPFGNSALDLSWILFWPYGTIDEAKTEIDNAVDYLKRFHGRIRICPPNIFNGLRITDGAKFTGLPAGLGDERYALLYQWTMEMTNDISSKYKYGEWSQDDNFRWLMKAQRLIDLLEKQSFSRDANGNVSYSGTIEQRHLPALKIIDGRVFNVSRPE